MNTLDIIILIIVSIPVLMGFKNGMLRGIFSLAGIIGGLLLAGKYYDVLSVKLSFLDVDTRLLSLLSFIAILIATYALSVFIAGRISRLNTVTRTFDKIMGIFLGLFKGLIIASLFLIFTTETFNFFPKETIEGSKFYGVTAGIAPAVYDFIVKSIPGANDFHEQLNRMTSPEKKI